MKFKKYALSLLVLGVCFSGSMNVSFANENSEPTDTKAIIQKQISAFDELDKKIREDRSETIKPGKKQFKSVQSEEGTYPTKTGSVLVTRDGFLDKLVGHACIVYNSSSTVESFPGSGVGTYPNDWNTRYNVVYGTEVNKASTDQNQSAASYAYEHIGSPYNWNFLNPDTTDSFYCSQLVYQAYKQTSGIDLNYNGGMVVPIDLVNSDLTDLVYTKGV